MSRAFIKEPDGDAVDELPERPISAHPNFVTPEGFRAIDAELDRLRAALDAAGDDRAQAARVRRDVRYWQVRRATAEVIPPLADTTEVRFGSTVTIKRKDGRKQVWRIVGEDEADPAEGTVSYVSPLARALAGKRVGDSVEVSGGEAEVTAIE